MGGFSSSPTASTGGGGGETFDLRDQWALAVEGAVQFTALHKFDLHLASFDSVVKWYSAITCSVHR